MTTNFNEWGFTRLPNGGATVTVGDSVAKARMVGNNVELEYTATVAVKPQKHADEIVGKDYDKLSAGVILGPKPDLSIHEQVCNCVQVGVHRLAETFGCNVDVVDNAQELARANAAVEVANGEVADLKAKLAELTATCSGHEAAIESAKTAAESDGNRIIELEAEIKTLKTAKPAKSRTKKATSKDDSAD